MMAVLVILLALPAPAGPRPRPAPIADDTIRAPLPLEYEPLAVETAFDLGKLPAAEQAVAATLVDVIRRAAVQESDVAAAERLFSRQRGVTVAWRLLRAVHVKAAEQARAERRAERTLDHLRRLGQVAPEPAVEIDTVVVLLEQARWSDAEARAREIVSGRADMRGRLALGYALLRQDRAAEALEALSPVEEIEGEKGRKLLALVRSALAMEQGMNNARHWHFHVLYEGPPEPELGRALTERLESHFAMLAGLFEYEPAAKIPVILLTTERYHQLTGAPHWSGGYYSSSDGRIRVPVGGLSAAAVGEIDGTLLHELVHAFVAERTAGTAPRFLHEALAQYFEGDRVAAKLPSEALGALADGRIAGVGGFYVEALAFAEYLMHLAGPRGVNDLLAALGETGDVDAGFRAAYGRDYKRIQADWREWMQTRYR